MTTETRGGRDAAGAGALVRDGGGVAGGDRPAPPVVTAGRTGLNPHATASGYVPIMSDFYRRRPE